jgi:tripartite-type tricarboxylate transporter receptor subunit TctC
MAAFRRLSARNPHRRFAQVTIAAFAAAVLYGAASAAQADAVSAFYASHPINILVGFGPGGGYDLYARTLARHFGDHMPGHPSVVVQNVPGAAGLTLVNSLYNVDPKDGSEFGIFDRLIPLDPLLEGSQSHFDPLKFSWLGSTSQEVLTCAGWYKARAKTLAQLHTTEMLMAGTGSTSDATIYPKLFSKILGLKFKVVNGYQGGADAILAMQRGEVEGFCPWGLASIESGHPDWLRDHKINVFMQLGLHKNPALADVPLALDLAKTPADRQALELMLSPDLFARPFVAPPGVPPARLRALRKAFKETVQDPAFIADARKEHLEVEYVSDAEILTELKKIYATPRAVVERVKAAIK